MKRIFLILGVALILLSIYPLFLMGREVFYERTGEQDFQMDPISVNFMELGKVQILGKGTPIPVESIKVNNYLINENESVPLMAMEDYSQLIQKSGLNSLRYVRDYAWSGNRIRIEDQFQLPFVTATLGLLFTLIGLLKRNRKAY